MFESDLKAILEAAVKIEEQSYTLYTMAQKKVNSLSSRKFLQELAEEELIHKKKLVAAARDEREMGKIGSQGKKIEDLKIVDVMRDTALSEDADYQRILIYAAKREKATFEYYTSLANGLEGTKTGELFTRLAEEELKHKNKLEREYDEQLLSGN